MHEVIKRSIIKSYVFLNPPVCQINLACVLMQVIHSKLYSFHCTKIFDFFLGVFNS